MMVVAAAVTHEERLDADAAFRQVEFSILNSEFSIHCSGGQVPPGIPNDVGSIIKN
jgi:hypothetical protein